MEVKRRVASRTEVSALVVALAAPGVLAARWLAPQPAPPTEPPALTLRADEVRAAISEEHRLALSAPPDDDPNERRRRELYRAQGRAELRGGERNEGELRREGMAEALAALAAAHGDAAIAAVRARDVERAIRALAGEGSRDERAEELGRFAETLRRWGAIVDDRRCADELVVRALAAARWNLAHRRPPTDGFSELHRRAYYGWLALHGEAASSDIREQALAAYQSAGADDADEALGVFAWFGGAPEAAAAAFLRAYERTGSVRLRNHALFALAAVHDGAERAGETTAAPGAAPAEAPPPASGAPAEAAAPGAPVEAVEVAAPGALAAPAAAPVEAVEVAAPGALAPPAAAPAEAVEVAAPGALAAPVAAPAAPPAPAKAPE
jgi:hypothetical protein